MIGCWRFKETPTQNVVVTVGDNETTSLLLDSLLGGFTKASESWISETTLRLDAESVHFTDGNLASSMNMFINKVDTYLRRAGYT